MSLSHIPNWLKNKMATNLRWASILWDEKVTMFFFIKYDGLLFAPTRFRSYCRAWNWGHLRHIHTGSRAWMNGVGRKVGAPRQWYIVFSIPYSTSVILQSTKIYYSRLFVNDKSLCGLLTWYYVVQSQHSRGAGKHRDGGTGPHQILADTFVYLGPK